MAAVRCGGAGTWRRQQAGGIPGHLFWACSTLCVAVGGSSSRANADFLVQTAFWRGVVEGGAGGWWPTAARRGVSRAAGRQHWLWEWIGGLGALLPRC